MTTEVPTTIFSDNAWVILCKRYFWRAPEAEDLIQPKCERCGDQHETEHQFLDRISMNNPEYLEELIRPLKFLPNSPTLMNIGTPWGGTLSACFKFDVEDTMFDDSDGIMPVMMKAGKVLKAGGGVGYSLHVRPEGAVVHSTHGKALGPIGVMRMYNQMALEITQGGKREAAQMAILHCQHPDLEKFIHCKDIDPDKLGTFNISVALTDEFMRIAVEYPESYQRHVLMQMAESAWKTGDPGCFFIDAAERGNPTPWAGRLTGTNPCGEVPLLRNEPCNLGSIDLSKHLMKRADVVVIDWDALRHTVRLAIRYLDDVLDRNVFPDTEITEAALYTRKLGLGVMGFHDALIEMDIQYDSPEALSYAAEIMKCIRTEADAMSLMLSAEKEVAPCFLTEQAIEADAIQYRNATRLCIAPTGTIAQIAGCSTGMEPIFALENTRRMGDGTILKEKPLSVVRALERGFTPKTSHDIAWQYHVEMQAVFQKEVDLAVSKTINMPEDATPESIFNAYIMMWQSGCKGGTIYRDGSRANQILKTVDPNSLHNIALGPHPILSQNGHWRDVLPIEEVQGIRHKFEVGGLEGYVHVGTYEDGSPAEMFLDVARQGSTIDGTLNWFAQTFSVALQIAHKYGIPFTVFTDKWLERKFEPSGMTTNPQIPHASSVADYLGKWLNSRFGATSAPAPVQTLLPSTGELCPQCGGQLIPQESCLHCNSCGFERC